MKRSLIYPSIRTFRCTLMTFITEHSMTFLRFHIYLLCELTFYEPVPCHAMPFRSTFKWLQKIGRMRNRSLQNKQNALNTHVTLTHSFAHLATAASRCGCVNLLRIAPINEHKMFGSNPKTDQKTNTKNYQCGHWGDTRY